MTKEMSLQGRAPTRVILTLQALPVQVILSLLPLLRPLRLLQTLHLHRSQHRHHPLQRLRPSETLVLVQLLKLSLASDLMVEKKLALNLLINVSVNSVFSAYSYHQHGRIIQPRIGTSYRNHRPIYL